MKVGMLGTGDVGKALGKAFIALGHEVMMGSREGKSPKAEAWVKESGSAASAGTFAQAAQFGQIVVLATLGQATEGLLRAAGPDKFKGKLVLDATNPLDFSQGMPPRLFGGVGDSLGERIQKALPGARVVKAFNSVSNPMMFKPQTGGLTPDMFICGDDKGAKEEAARLLKDFGWNSIDVGGIATAHYLECLCAIYVLTALKDNNWMMAYKLIGARSS